MPPSDSTAAFSNSSRWSELFGFGYGEHLYYAYVTKGMPGAVGIWHLNVTKAGKYTVYAYVENGIGTVSRMAPYTVRASGHNISYSVDISLKTGWYKIGDFDFDEGSLQYVQLMDATSERFDENEGRRVVFDAIQVVPYGTDVEGVVIPGQNDDQSDDPWDSGKDNNEGGDVKGGNGQSSASEEGCAATPLRGSSQAPWVFLGIAGLLGVAVRRRKI